MSVSEDIAEEHLLNRIEPDYPEEAREQRLQGTLILDMIIMSAKTVRYIVSAKLPEIPSLLCSLPKRFDSGNLLRWFGTVLR